MVSILVVCFGRPNLCRVRPCAPRLPGAPGACGLEHHDVVSVICISEHIPEHQLIDLRCWLPCARPAPDFFVVVLTPCFQFGYEVALLLLLAEVDRLRLLRFANTHHARSISQR